MRVWSLKLRVKDGEFNPFPVILNAPPPPSLILNLDFGGLVLILGGFPAPTGMTGITVIRL